MLVWLTDHSLVQIGGAQVPGNALISATLNKSQASFTPNFEQTDIVIYHPGGDNVLKRTASGKFGQFSAML